MFSFFKNKMKEPEAPKQLQKGGDFAPFQQTKVEDDVASFEVPDFSEEDLDFDLGLGEFMPQGTLPPAPKGLPTDLPDLPPLPKKEGQSSEDTPVNKAQFQSDLDLSTIPFDFPKKEEVKEAVKIEQVAPVVETENKQFSWAGEGVEEESPGEDLPKFNVSAGISFSELKSLSEEEQKPNQIKTQKLKKEDVKDKRTVKNSSEDLFLQKKTFNKIIILAEDTMKKSGSAETMKTNYVSMSELQDAHVDDLTRTMKAIRDSIMLADAKLFGKGDV